MCFHNAYHDFRRKKALFYSSLVLIKALSITVEAKRVFLATGLFVSKLRTSLFENTIDSLCYLRLKENIFELKIEFSCDENILYIFSFDCSINLFQIKIRQAQIIVNN